MSFFILTDTELLFFINQNLANSFFDILMPFITNLHNWRIPILIIWIALMIFGGKKGRVAGLLIIFVVVMSDQLSSAIIKPSIGRIRPCHLYENLRLLVHCGGKYSFPSSHASNISAAAFLFSYFYRKGSIIFFCIALVVGFSRIYVGVHYPLDVLVGFVVGFCSTFVILKFYLTLIEKYPGTKFIQRLKITG